MAGVGAYKAGSWLARTLPKGAVVKLARTGGAVASRFAGDGATMVARNLARVEGQPLSSREARDRVAKTYAWYAQYYVESFRLPDVDVDELDRGFSFEGVGQIESHCGPGKSGAILALPHLGSWEWAAFWLAQVIDVQVTAIVEPLQPPEVFDWFVELRESLGMEIHALGPDAGREVMAALKRGRLVCLLCDRDLQGNGVAVDFFGERTTLPAGPALMALRAGVPIIPTAVPWRGDVRHGWCRPALDTARRSGASLREDVARITQEIANEFEVMIGETPEQWHLLNPNWPSDYTALGRDVPDHLKAL